MQEGYSICFNEWALDKSIKDELGLLLIISSLTAEKGYCYASNEYLAQLFTTNTTTISRKIKKLEEKKYIKIKYEKKGCSIISRKIQLTKVTPTINKNDNRTIIKNDNGTINKNDNRTIIKNDKENNISNLNNTSINNNIYSPVSQKQDKIPYKDIIDYLNLKVGTHYRVSSNKTKTLIKARYNEKYTLEDFKKVIDNKCEEWLTNDKMKGYLRPETLFGSKFESYLNQKNKQPTEWFDKNNKNQEPTEEEQQEIDKLINEISK